MKLFTKIFLCTMTVITTALSVMGYMMIADSFNNAVDREIERGLEEYQILKFALQAEIFANSENGNLNDETIKTAAEQTALLSPNKNQTAILDGNGEIIFSDFPKEYDFSKVNSVSEGGIMHSIETRDGDYCLAMMGRFAQSGIEVRLITTRDITPIVQEKNAMEKQYVATFTVVLCAAITVMLVLSYFLTSPIKRLIESVRSFENGNYQERAQIINSDETGELSRNFNAMAETIEQTIKQLELNAQQKEDFVANFAHELKTPLTSVIGYADMIYQKENLSREEIKKAASYIVDEGMRLEALSLKLMELIILNKTEFTFMEMRASEVLSDIAETLRPLMKKKKIEFTVSAQEAFINIEFDLFKTLILNLADNASKAESRHISLCGVFENGKYMISVTDDGCGIPEDKLSRITEAFYMIDKSRSRSQHGAGLGLAIASKIAKLHGSSLEYKSHVGIGTTVTLTLSGIQEA